MAEDRTLGDNTAGEKTVTLSPAANAAVEEMSRDLGIPFEEVIGLAIGTQRAIVKQTGAGNSVTIAPNGKTFKLMRPPV